MMITSPEVCELVGCTYRQLDHWERQGIIRCARPATGVGSSRGWTLEQAAVVRACLTLAERGALRAGGTKMLRSFTRYLARHPELWDGQVVVDKDGKVTTSLSDGWVVDLAGCRRWVGAEPDRLAKVG